MTDHAHQSDHEPDGEHEPEHHGSLPFYILIAVVLVFLTACSYATHTAVWESTIGTSIEIKRLWMMAVSCAKAMCVIMVFMHLYWEANWKWVLTIPASFMSLFLALALVPDVGMRQNNGFSRYSQERLLYEADPIPPRAVVSHDDHVHDSETHPADEQIH
jgi:cytochrome c oxidase subunit 4